MKIEISKTIDDVHVDDSPKIFYPTEFSVEMCKLIEKDIESKGFFIGSMEYDEGFNCHLMYSSEIMEEDGEDHTCCLRIYHEDESDLPDIYTKYFKERIDEFTQ